LVASATGWVPSSAELRSVDLGSGKIDPVLPGVSVEDYDISRDEKEVAFTTIEGGESKIWLAPLDRHAPPRQLAAGDQVSFGAEGELVFRSVEGKKNLPVRIKEDGSGREPLTTSPILEKYSVSPDGDWVLAFSSGVGEYIVGELHAVPIHGGATRNICAGGCRATWSSNGRFFYVEVQHSSPTSPGKTLVFPVPAGKSLPDLPASGIDSAAGVERPGVQIIAHSLISPGLDASTYVFTKTDLQRNLFRIPLH
jgi:hypothetical protein